MALGDDELKAHMMAAAQTAIERLLAERAKKGEVDLSDIEHLVRQVGEQIMESMTTDLVNAEAAQEEQTVCPECGGEMRYKGKKGRNLVTDTGEVRVARGHYYCPTCRKGFFPPRPPMEAERDDLQCDSVRTDGVDERPCAI
jgi:uncharacterized protein YbbK (DUF523 family)